MKYNAKIFSILTILLVFISLSQLEAQIIGGDILNEAPLMAIPEEMTFEEYRDINRRLTVEGYHSLEKPIRMDFHSCHNRQASDYLLIKASETGVYRLFVRSWRSQQQPFAPAEKENGTDWKEDE